MKTNILFSLALILCIFKANSAPDPVLAGLKALRTGVKYYAMPTDVDGFGGSMFPAPVGNKSCPLGVVGTITEGLGLPLIITPVNPKKGVIRVSTDVNIKFQGSNKCHESNVWKLKYDKSIKEYAVMLGGVEGNPGKETLDNWFKIEKTTDGMRDGYKFVFCPSVCSDCKVMCRDIGHSGYSRLVLGGEPLLVEFYEIM
ncbi:hypothetical protein R6Q59_003862 [Mikania micrantha]